MSFKVKLKVAGKEFNVVSCSYQLKQETDATGRPSSITRGGKIEITVESTGETDFMDWMCQNWERKDGSIIYIKRDNNATLKELEFKEAYMVSYQERFESTDKQPVTETFVISAREIGIGGATHINEWPKN